MNNMWGSQGIKVALAFLILLTACGSPSGSKPTSIGSPKGSVPFGEKVYSPDGKMYACEVDPKDHGKIGIYDLAQDKRLSVISARQHPSGHPNDLKGLAWSFDSKRLAAMYHYGRGGHITIVDVDGGQEVKSIPIYGHYHALAFSKDGAKIYAEGSVFDVN
jgi:WD40 repeat protein